MENSIELTKYDLEKIKPLALDLTEYWQLKKPDGWLAQTLSGLYAEYATVKFLNYHLGASPRIVFNETYVNGSDGGVDFYFPDKNFSWDVKSSVDGIFTREHLRSTKAQTIIGVHCKGNMTYEILGFIPVTRIVKDNYSKDDFREIEELKKGFPDNFIGPIPIQRHTAEPEQIGKVAKRILQGFKILEHEQKRAEKL